MSKSVGVYISMKRKLCSDCWIAEKETQKSIVNALPTVEDKDPPLGYHFIVNDWFFDWNKGKRYADYIFHSMRTSSS